MVLLKQWIKPLVLREAGQLYKASLSAKLSEP